MLKQNRKNSILLLVVLAGLISFSAVNATAIAQYFQSQLTPPPPPPAESSQDADKNRRDSIPVRFQVRPTVPQTYDDLKQGEYAADLKTPSNITTSAEYDYETGCYVIHTKVGDNDIVTLFLLSPAEYNDMALRESMIAYYREKNAETAEAKKRIRSTSLT